jgi:excinuclease ABC subunit C
MSDISSTESFFNGATGKLINSITNKMTLASLDKQYEQAAILRDRINSISTLHGGGDIMQKHGESKTMDVLGVSIEGSRSIVSRFHIEKGTLLDREQHLLDTPENSSPGDVISAFISQYYADRILPNTLVLSDRPEDMGIHIWLKSEQVEISVPTIGREAKLVDLALKNSRQTFVPVDAIMLLKDSLNLINVSRIEGFDISHSSGTEVVGSNVVFVDGYPEKSSYRRIKLNEINDDYSNMYDLICWRATRAVNGTDSRPFPNLLLIDGGLGQLKAALKALSDSHWEIPAISLKKPKDIIVTPIGNQMWPPTSPHLHLLQRIRDEAHRFANTYHRNLRDGITTALDSIPGIGPNTREKLFQNFGSVAAIRSASVEELCSVDGVGKKTAIKIKNQL